MQGDNDKKGGGSGGWREGAGRKPTDTPNKIPLGTRVVEECKAKLVRLSAESGHSQAVVVEYAISKLKSVPKKPIIDFS